MEMEYNMEINILLKKKLLIIGNPNKFHKLQYHKGK